jgi:hypothetical protein
MAEWAQAVRTLYYKNDVKNDVYGGEGEVK